MTDLMHSTGAARPDSQEHAPAVQAALLARQKRLLHEGGVFIRVAGDLLARNLPAVEIADEVSLVAGVGDPNRLYAAIGAIASAMTAAARRDALEPENLSLCVFMTAVLARELERQGMALDEAQLREAMPGLDVAWCRAQYREKCLVAMTAAGHA